MSLKNIKKPSFSFLSNISVIFFDLDNTLIPTRKGDSKACKKLCEILQEQYKLSHEDANKCTTQFLKSFRSCPDNSQTTLDSWRSYLWSEALPQNLKHFNLKIYEQWLHLRYRYLSLTPEYEDMLKKLRKSYLLGLITNGPSNAQWEKIHKLNLSNYFDCILVSSDLPWEKPNPNIFLTACNFLNVKSSQCIMIGDKLETDIKGAKDAKLAAAIWIPLNNNHHYNHNYNNQLMDEDDDETIQPIVPDIIIESLPQLFNYLPNQLNNSGLLLSSLSSSSLSPSPLCSNSSFVSDSSSTKNNYEAARRRRSSYQFTTSKSSSPFSSIFSTNSTSSVTTTTATVNSRRQNHFQNNHRSFVHKRVASLPEFDGNSCSDNSVDSFYS